MSNVIEHEVPTTPNARRKGLWIGVAAASVAVLGAGAFIGLASPGLKGESSAMASGPSAIDTLVPSDADTLVITPAGKDWWPKIQAMAVPESNLGGVDLAAADLEIEHLGYSRSPDHTERELDMAGPLRLLYIETPSAEAAASVEDWMSTADGFDNRRVYVEGDIVVVAPSWVADYSVPETSLAETEDVGSEVSKGKATLWMNVDQEAASLAVDEASAESYTDLLRTAYGFQEGTTWLGISDDGASWAGKFRAGGVDPEQIDFDGVEERLRSGEVVLQEVVEQQTKYEIIDPGMGAILSVSGFSSPTQERALGGDVSAIDFPQVDDAVVSSYADVSNWNQAITGMGAPREGVSARYISANTDEMVVSFSYGLDMVTDQG